MQINKISFAEGEISNEIIHEIVAGDLCDMAGSVVLGGGEWSCGV